MANVSSIDVLCKYSSTKTNDSFIVFDSSDFKKRDKIYFEIKASSDVCTHLLFYQF